MTFPELSAETSQTEQKDSGAVLSFPAIDPFERERLVMTIWPSIGMHRLGRLLGRIVSCRWGWAPVTVGNILALLLAPLAAIVFLAKYLPGQVRRYVVTSRRILIVTGYRPRIVSAIDHGAWERVEVVYRPGQQVLRCADLVFYAGSAEVFRLPGVPQPEAYQHALNQFRDTLSAFAPILKPNRS